MDTHADTSWIHTCVDTHRHTHTVSYRSRAGQHPREFVKWGEDPYSLRGSDRPQLPGLPSGPPVVFWSHPILQRPSPWGPCLAQQPHAGQGPPPHTCLPGPFSQTAAAGSSLISPGKAESGGGEADGRGGFMGPCYLRFVCSELGGNYGLIVRKSVPSPGAFRLRSGPSLMQEGAESGLRDSGRLWQVVGLHSGGWG